MTEDFRSTAAFGAELGGIFLLVALLLLAPVLVNNIVAYSTWEETTATVVDAYTYDEVRHGMISTGKVTMPTTYRVNVIAVTYVYEVDGASYTGTCKASNSLSSGAEIRIIYNPDNPYESRKK